MVSNRSLGGRRLNTLTKKIPYRRILRRIIVVGMLKEYVSIIYKG